jgi:CrcB protein
VIWLVLALGAGLGAASRFHTTRLMQGRWGRRFPWGTFMANVLGSMLLGCLVGVGAVLAVPDSLAVGLGVGFCGALTTYSSFSYDTLELIEQRRGARACANVVLNMGGAMAAVVVGYTAGSSVATRLLVRRRGPDRRHAGSVGGDGGHIRQVPGVC